MKRVSFLFMHGGVSQMDSYDRKPTLVERHGQPLPFSLPGLICADQLGKVFAPKWQWKQHGDCGQWVSELFPHTAKIVDKLCFLKGLHTDGEAAWPGRVRLHTGKANFVRPSLGSWIGYGLGTLNENLPRLRLHRLPRGPRRRAEFLERLPTRGVSGHAGKACLRSAECRRSATS